MFGYCGNNPVNYLDPTGHTYFEWDLFPNQQAGEVFTKWYTEADEHETDSNGELTLDAKMKQSIRAVAVSLEFSIGFGMGFYGGISFEDLAGANAGLYQDFVRFQYIDGQYDICQYRYDGYDANIAYIFSLGNPQIQVNSYLDDTNEWVTVEPNEVMDIFGVGAYLFAGGTVEFNWHFIELGQKLREIWRE